VREAIKFLEETKLPWVLLHPAMIYGVQGENNVQRIENLIRRFYVTPLRNGGRSLIQPIHVEDVVEAIVRAIDANGIIKRSIHFAGPLPVTYADFIRTIADAIQCRVWVIPVPYRLMTVMAWLMSLVLGVPIIKKSEVLRLLEEVLRLLEDMAVDVHEMQDVLKLSSRPLCTGLAEALNTKPR